MIGYSGPFRFFFFFFVVGCSPARGCCKKGLESFLSTLFLGAVGKGTEEGELISVEKGE